MCKARISARSLSSLALSSPRRCCSRAFSSALFFVRIAWRRRSVAWIVVAASSRTVASATGSAAPPSIALPSIVSLRTAPCAPRPPSPSTVRSSCASLEGETATAPSRPPSPVRSVTTTVPGIRIQLIHHPGQLHRSETLPHRLSLTHRRTHGVARVDRYSCVRTNPVPPPRRC